MSIKVSRNHGIEQFPIERHQLGFQLVYQKIGFGNDGATVDQIFYLLFPNRMVLESGFVLQVYTSRNGWVCFYVLPTLSSESFLDSVALICTYFFKIVSRLPVSLSEGLFCEKSVV